jgi:hypothetical protein
MDNNMYKIERIVKAKATAIVDGRETELMEGDYLTKDQLETLKVYGDKLIYRIDQNCTGEICGIDIEAYMPPVHTDNTPMVKLSPEVTGIPNITDTN